MIATDCQVLISSDDPPKVLKSASNEVLAECEPGPGCPCQPTHMSISWQADDSGDVPAGEPQFHESFTAEIDIPDLLGSGCVYNYSDSRLFVTVTDCEDAIVNNPTGSLDLGLYYDFGLNLWFVSFYIIIGDHAIKCNAWEAWPHPDSALVLIDGTNPSGTRTFACPPATIDEDLTGGGPNPNFTGHGNVVFT